jgi:hypothetical protein
MNREDLFIVRVKVDGRDLGRWDTFDGGDSTADSTKYRPGGKKTPKALGGPKDYDDVTTSRLYEEDVNAIHAWIDSRNGVGAVEIAKTPTDAEGNAFGRTRTFQGLLVGVSEPTSDSESADAAKITLTIQIESVV